MTIILCIFDDSDYLTALDQESGQPGTLLRKLIRQILLVKAGILPATTAKKVREHYRKPEHPGD